MHGIFDQFVPALLVGNITNGVAMPFVVAGLVTLLSLVRFGQTPGKIQIVLELVHNQIAGLLGPHARQYTPLMMTMFLYITIANLLGAIPGVFPITSHVSVTFGLALVVFFTCLFAGLVLNTRNFIAHFVLDGVPTLLVPFLAMMEVFLYLLKPLTLAVRLGVNITVGHIVMSVLAGVGASFAGGTVAILPVTVFVNLLELMFCVIQAAIFTILGCTYLEEACH